jgi:hypothetical protein
MSIKFSADDKVLKDPRVTFLRTISTLNDQLREPGGMFDQVKAAMAKAKARFVESPHAVGQLRDGYARSEIDAHKAFKACTANGISAAKFLACCTVKKKELLKLLGENDIEKISTVGEVCDPMLFTEFKPGITIAADDLADVLTTPLGKHLGTLNRAA